ncbi:MAG TPA: VOC family protein [Terriglobales bacterium]|nr:VOC family protein [Terriglobales bacterium]
MNQDEHNYQMDYIEFPATDIAATKRFYNSVFGWNSSDYGPEYISFHDGRLAGGFTMSAKPARGGPLVVLYAKALEDTHKNVIAAGGKIVVETFEFPGGRRFHFADPNGNELAVWSE